MPSEPRRDHVLPPRLQGLMGASAPEPAAEIRANFIRGQHVSVLWQPLWSVTKQDGSFPFRTINFASQQQSVAVAAAVIVYTGTGPALLSVKRNGVLLAAG